MASIYTTSITVDFALASDSSDILKAEVDSREDGLNGGNTSFIPGVDAPYLLLFKSTSVSILSKDVTAGNLRSIGHGTYLVDEYITFTQERSASVSYPISSGFTYKWIGRNNGVVVYTETEISVPNDVLGVLKVSYNSTYESLQLANVPSTLNGETDFPVLVHIIGES